MVQFNLSHTILNKLFLQESGLLKGGCIDSVLELGYWIFICYYFFWTILMINCSMK